MLLKIIEYFSLKLEIEDYDQIHSEIEKGIVFRGTNLWILIFAIVVASVGLNTNSTAVIIGAMLISPLMGPINGMGYGLASYDFALFRRALKNFGFAVVTSLVASTLYFVISPVSTAHSELLARTSPTIYDVLIALFGGLAGIVAISTKQKGNVIPGVAIATALMPPLCTAGFGLATGQFNFFLGALYLFTINTVFIGISSIIVSQLLKFPIRAEVDAIQKKKIARLITSIIVITILPSIFFGYRLVQKERFNENAIRYTKNIGVFEGNFLLKNEVDADERTIKLIYGGNNLTEETKKRIIEQAANFSLKDVQIEIEQGFSINQENDNNQEVLRAEINRLNFALSELKKSKDSVVNIPQMGKQILKEITPLYPQITSCAYSETFVFKDSVVTNTTIDLVLFETKNELEKENKLSIKNWLNARLNKDSIVVYFSPQNL